MELELPQTFNKSVRRSWHGGRTRDLAGSDATKPDSMGSWCAAIVLAAPPGRFKKGESSLRRLDPVLAHLHARRDELATFVLARRDEDGLAGLHVGARARRGLRHGRARRHENLHRPGLVVERDLVGAGGLRGGFEHRVCHRRLRLQVVGRKPLVHGRRNRTHVDCHGRAIGAPDRGDGKLHARLHVGHGEGLRNGDRDRFRQIDGDGGAVVGLDRNDVSVEGGDYAADVGVLLRHSGGCRNGQNSSHREQTKAIHVSLPR